jgi:hypothetical protein
MKEDGSRVISADTARITMIRALYNFRPEITT